MKPRSDKEIDKKFNEIDKLFDQISEENKEELEHAKIKPIHPKFPYAQNGIMAYIATMGSGKSYNYIKFAAQQQFIFDQPFYELVVICSTSANFDKTVQAYKKSITESKLVAIKDTSLLDFLNKYMRRILKYNSIHKFIDSDFKDLNEEITRILDKHRLKAEKKNKKELIKLIEYLSMKLAKYNWKTYPHRMLLILDDFASHPLLRSKETEMSRLLKKLRHFNITTAICVQTTQSIPRDLKRILADCVLFPGISSEDFNDLMKNGPFGAFNKKQLWDIYSKLKNQNDMFRIHIKAQILMVTYANTKEPIKQK